MPKLKTAEGAYDSCLGDGYIRKVENINKDRIKSLVDNAEIIINTTQIVIKAIDKKAKEWMSVYTSYYDVLRIYAEALLIFSRVSITNHQCLFSCLCVKHPELELDWDFLERIRTKRNGVNYYGEKITYDDWKADELQLKLYISTLKKEIIKRLSE